MSVTARSVPAVVMAIAGSDSSAGAGIQADLKAMSACGVYATTVITAVTAQNTQGVDNVWLVPTEMVKAQVNAVMADLPVKCIKIGMLGSEGLVCVVHELLQELADIPVVLDPVMVSTSGAQLLEPQAQQALRELLLPRANLITPNLHEAAVLLDTDVASSEAEMSEQANGLLKFGSAAVLLKGGHLPTGEAFDVLATSEGLEVFKARRHTSRNTHGTGCSLAAAIAAGLAHQQPLHTAIGAAKEYLTGAIAAAADWNLGMGHGPIDHFYRHHTDRDGSVKPTTTGNVL